MGRCDSWVVETDVHYPTDISLLFDAVRKVIELSAKVPVLPGWRQSAHLVKKSKRLMRQAQKLKRSSSKNPRKKAVKEEEIKKAHTRFIEHARRILDKAQKSMAALSDADREQNQAPLERFMAHAHRQIDQIQRRVIEGQSIPHEEKVFSVFEEHTEWISKGKAGVPQELGLRICLLEDQYGFVLHHKIMRRETDEKVAVDMALAAKEKFAALRGCSFDKGFYSPANKQALAGILDKVVMPKKGRLTLRDKEEEHAEEFIAARYKHAAVESAISAMENHGLDRCFDMGLDAFERYVALAVTARNLQILGGVLMEKERKRAARRSKYNNTRASRKQGAA